MDNIKMRPYDGVAVACSLILPGLLYTGLSDLVEKNNAAAWLTLTGSFVLMLFIFLITAALMGRYEGKNIIEAAAIVMGKPAAVLYGIALGAYFCYFAGIYAREGAEILKIYALSQTPIYVVVGLVVLTAVILNFFGSWSLIKSAGVFFVLTLLGIALALLLGLNRYNPDCLVPVLGSGIREIIKNSLYTASMFDGVILLTFFAPAFISGASLRKSGIISLSVAAGASVLLCLCYVMMFSPPTAESLVSGFVEMGKSSYYNHFFYRFESILLFFLIFATIILVSLGILIAKESFGRSVNNKAPKVVTVVCGIAVFTIALIPTNILELTDIYLFSIRQYSVFFVAGFPILLFIISSIKRFFKHEKY